MQIPKLVARWSGIKISLGIPEFVTGAREQSSGTVPSHYAACLTLSTISDLAYILKHSLKNCCFIVESNLFSHIYAQKESQIMPPISPKS